MYFFSQECLHSSFLCKALLPPFPSDNMDEPPYFTTIKRVKTYRTLIKHPLLWNRAGLTMIRWPIMLVGLSTLAEKSLLFGSITYKKTIDLKNHAQIIENIAIHYSVCHSASASEWCPVHHTEASLHKYVYFSQVVMAVILVSPNDKVWVTTHKEALLCI